MSKRTNHALLALAFSSLFVMGFVDNLRSPYFSSFLQDIGLNDIDGSFFFVVPSTFAFIGSLLVTTVMRRWTVRTNLLIAGLLMCFGFALLSLINSFWSMIFFCAIYGLGLGTSNVLQSLGVHAGASEHNSRRMFGGLQSMYAMASFSAPFLAGWMFEAGVNWTVSFRSAALVCALLMTGIFFVGRPSKKLIEDVEPHTPTKKSVPSKMEMWLVTAPLGFYLMGEMSISTRLALYLERDLGYAKDSASFWLAFFFAVFTVGRLCCWIFDTRRWPQIKVLKACASLGCVFYSLGLLVHPLFFICAGLCMAPFFPTALDWIGSTYKQHADRALAIGTAFGYFTVVIMHFVLGQMTEIYGLKAALWIGPIGLFITVLNLILSSKTLSQSKTTR